MMFRYMVIIWVCQWLLSIMLITRPRKAEIEVIGPAPHTVDDISPTSEIEEINPSIDDLNVSPS